MPVSLILRARARLVLALAAATFLATLANSALPRPAHAHDGVDHTEIRAGDLVLKDAWSRATPAGARIGGGYITITNTGATPDRLLSFSSAVSARGEVHEMAVSDGVMRMRQLDAIVIAPGESVTLKPGGLHIMFMDLNQPLVVDQPVRGTLTFERAGPVEVTFGVAPAGSPGPAAHAEQGSHGAAHKPEHKPEHKH